MTGRVEVVDIADKIEIAELIARFAHCSDYGDWAGLASLYVPEVVTELEGLPVRYEGIEQQIEHAKESDRQAGGKNRHYNFNLFVAEDGGVVKAHYAFMNVNAGQQAMSAQIVVTGIMQDTVVRSPEGWKIAHRLVQFDQQFQLDF
jgi:hypothetical protein